MFFMFMAVTAGARVLSTVLDNIHLMAQAKRYKKIGPLVVQAEAARREEAARCGFPVDEPMQIILNEPKPRLYTSVDEARRGVGGDVSAIRVAEARFRSIEEHLEKCSRCGKTVTQPQTYHARS